MGRDKYLLEPNGKPQYQHLYEMTESLGLESYLSCTENQLDGLNDSYRLIIDEVEGPGPMAGIVSAIQQDRECNWLLVACDLVCMEAEALKRLIECIDQDHDIFTYQKDGSPFLETTATVYSPTCFSVMDTLFQQEAYSLQEVLKRVRVKRLTPSDERVLHNANFPDEL